MSRLGLSFLLGGLAVGLAVGSAAAQQPASAAERQAAEQAAAAQDLPMPTDAERQAALREYAPPKGIGGCVLTEIDPAVRTTVLTSFGLGQPGVPPGLAPAVAKVAEICTGRPYSASDAALSTAVLGAFKRTAVGLFFATGFAIGEHRLDAAWKSASASEKAPFLRAAKEMLDPKGNPIAPTVADAQPLARRLKITSTNPSMLAPVQQYFLATAFSEMAEAQLSAEGAQPR